jgi:hypothetical protein
VVLSMEWLWQRGSAVEDLAALKLGGRRCGPRVLRSLQGGLRRSSETVESCELLG